MRMRKWEPMVEFDDLFSRFGSLMNWDHPRFGRESQWQPRTDISEDKESYKLHIELPEIKKEDIQVSVDHGILTLSGERHEQRSDATHHLTERFYGQFSRSFSLPENVDSNNVEAEFKDGMLYLTLPKVETEDEEPHMIDIH